MRSTDLVIDAGRRRTPRAGTQAGIDLPVGDQPVGARRSNDEALPDRVLSALAEHGVAPASLTRRDHRGPVAGSVERARDGAGPAAGQRHPHRDRRLRQRLRGDDAICGNCPIDEIKLDRQFVAPILRDRARRRDRAIGDRTGATTCGISSVAEGVEDKATADRLKEYGCGFVQGHYFSAPVPAEAVRLGVWGSAPSIARIPTATTRPSSA